MFWEANLAVIQAACQLAEAVLATLKATNKTFTPAAWVRSLHHCTFAYSALARFRWDVGVGVFPEGEEVHFWLLSLADHTSI